jgi:peptide-methionine (R)-S-oxide reductase
MKYPFLIFTAGFFVLILIAFLGQKSSTDLGHTHAELAVPVIQTAIQDTTPANKYPFQKSETEWKEILTSKEYRILRDKGTEIPFINEFDDNKREGIYVCRGCGQKLYSSEHKYDSGTGWPSFWEPIADSLVAEEVDNSWFMTRTEIVCSNCGGHLGHVFDDGPDPTGLRYCMNSAAMDFIEKEDIAEYEPDHNR